VRIELVTGDITTERVDVLVNAANERLARGSGVCGAIFAAAGPQLDAACESLGGCATGDAKITPGFELPADWIVHAVGPVWQGGGAGEAALLASAYRRALEVAEGVEARSVAFPAISTGIYGYPLDAATEIAIATVRSTKTQVERVHFVCFDQSTRAAYEAGLG